MPYAIRKRGSYYVVINKKTGKVKGKHRTRKKALAHMRALYHAESGRAFTRTKRKRRKRS